MISACCFVYNTFQGAYALFESMSSILPFVDEMVIMDLGSNDGTLEKLWDIALSNPKVRIVHSTFYKQDSSIFADLANDVVKECRGDTIWYFQSDEIWHEKLLLQTEAALKAGKSNLQFWRVQLKENFQKIKWFPHLVHRIIPKEKAIFVNDGMNTGDTSGSEICSIYDGGWFQRWGHSGSLHNFLDYPDKLPTWEMVLDISLIGGFIDNIPARKKMHAPFWHEPPVIWEEGCAINVDDWHERERTNFNWFKMDSPFAIPKIMKGLLGRPTYELRPEVFEALKQNKTRELLGI